MCRKRKISIGLIGALCMSLMTGCSIGSTGNVENYLLEPALTNQEVMDYYAKALAYDTVVSRSIEPNINNYEVTEVKDEETLKLVKDCVAKTEGLLSQQYYSSTKENEQYINESMYNYIKAMLNDKKLKNSNVSKINTALGYYFVDVDYDISASTIGTFNDTSSLIGLCGAFNRSKLTNTDSINTAFISTSVNKLNEYFTIHKIDKIASYDNLTGKIFVGSPSELPEVTTPDFSDSTITDNNGQVTSENQTNEVDGAAQENIVEATIEPSVLPTTQPTDGAQQAETVVPTEPVESTETTEKADKTEVTKMEPRKSINSQINFSTIVGYGESKSYIPNLSLIYNLPESTDGISGIGLYPSGEFGLSTFGFDRQSLEGKIKIRYVYKEDLLNNSKLTCTNIYVINYEITSGFNAENKNVVPDFLQDEFKILIDKSDRAMINCDISGLSNGSIYDDIGIAILRGYEEDYGNLIRQISTIRRVISRDIENNAYLVEIESLRQEGAESSDLYATYKDTIYAVIEQRESKFVITDWMIMNRTLINEPDINPDSATAKRIVSLGLTGEVSDITKTDVTGLIADLYNASTLRVLNGPKELPDGTKVEKGMYDCFDSNIEMLSSTKKEKLNSTIRALLIKYGTSTNTTMSGKVTEWIGGTNNQVEFTTEELINYEGKSDGIHLTCYYLVSSIEGKWVIDDIQILSQEELCGDELNTVAERIK